MLKLLIAVDGSAHALRAIEAVRALPHARSCGLQRLAGQGTQGIVAAEIVRVSHEQSVDQIAMGTHGRRPLGTLCLGSVAQRVIHLADLPVLLVK